MGFLAALESQGYLADPGAEPTTLLDGWSVEQAAAIGASACKLMLPYHPDHRLAGAQRAVAADVLADCRRVGVPLVLEPLFFGVTDAAERAGVVLTTVEHFASTGADLLKLPFPVDPAATVDHADRVAACRAITDRCEQPWAMLSGGGDFGSFAAQVGASIEGGGSGFMVGRALWGEAASCATDRRAQVVADIVLPRWHHLSDLVDCALSIREHPYPATPPSHYPEVTA